MKFNWKFPDIEAPAEREWHLPDSLDNYHPEDCWEGFYDNRWTVLDNPSRQYLKLALFNKALRVPYLHQDDMEALGWNRVGEYVPNIFQYGDEPCYLWFASWDHPALLWINEAEQKDGETITRVIMPIFLKYNSDVVRIAFQILPAYRVFKQTIDEQEKGADLERPRRRS